MRTWSNRLTLVLLCLFCDSLTASQRDLRKLLRYIVAPAYLQDIAELTGHVPVGPKKQRIRDRFSNASLKLAREHLIDEFLDMGFREVISEPFEIHRKCSFRPKRLWPRIKAGLDGLNLYVEIEGKTRPKEIVVLGAHYDTAGKNVPGANDNGSGVAAILSVARAMLASGVQPNRTLRFVLFDAEELLLYEGSEHHFNQSLLRGERVKAVFNVDMIAHSPSGLPFAAYDSEHYEGLADLLRFANRVSGLNFNLDHWRGEFDQGYMSDHVSALAMGIPAMSIFEDPRTFASREVDYDSGNHTPDDNFLAYLSRLNVEYATRVTRLIGAVTLLAAQSRSSWTLPYSEIQRNLHLAELQADGLSCVEQLVTFRK